MVNWLSEQNIQVDAKLTEPELFKLTKPLNYKGKKIQRLYNIQIYKNI